MPDAESGRLYHFRESIDVKAPEFRSKLRPAATTITSSANGRDHAMAQAAPAPILALAMQKHPCAIGYDVKTAAYGEAVRPLSTGPRAAGNSRGNLQRDEIMDPLSGSAVARNFADDDGLP